MYETGEKPSEVRNEDQCQSESWVGEDRVDINESHSGGGVVVSDDGIEMTGIVEAENSKSVTECDLYTQTVSVL